MPYFDHEGARLYYEEHGRGKPLLFLHGASLDMRQWEREVAHFSKGYRVITLDARGHGRSSLPPGAVPPDVFWRDAVALMDRLEIGKAVVCGLSMGGHVAIQMTIHAGERVAGLILIGAICTSRFNLFERVLLPINRFCLRLMPMSWIGWSEAVGLGQFAPQAKPYIRAVVGGMDHDGFTRVWKGITDMESRDGLEKIACPTLILIGDRDSLTRRQQPYLHAHIRHSRLVTIQNAGHGANLDAPEQVGREIEGFLAVDLAWTEKSLQ